MLIADSRRQLKERSGHKSFVVGVTSTRGSMGQPVVRALPAVQRPTSSQTTSLVHWRRFWNSGRAQSLGLVDMPMVTRELFGDPEKVA
jgi:hypothetical protein